MKKNYSKPLISVEAFAMDQPIAGRCTLPEADINSLKEFGCFAQECDFKLLPTGGFDWDGDGVADMHDNVCYHSNADYAFKS